jgi:CO/xanthine dehydrogenase Mo-binding subunit
MRPFWVQATARVSRASLRGPVARRTHPERRSVMLTVGIQSHDQGLETTLSQIAAEELGIDPARISLRRGDTESTAFGFGTFASRSMVMSGGAVARVSRMLRDKLCRIGAHLLQCDVAEVRAPMVLSQGRRLAHDHRDRAFADGRAVARGRPATRCDRTCDQDRPSAYPDPAHRIRHERHGRRRRRRSARGDRQHRARRPFRHRRSKRESRSTKPPSPRGASRPRRGKRAR